MITSTLQPSYRCQTHLKEGQVCVRDDMMIGPIYHCLDVPDECNGDPSCDCMGELACPETGFHCNDEGTADLSCYCPVC